MNKQKADERHPVFVFHEMISAKLAQPLHIVTAITMGMPISSCAKATRCVYGWVPPIAANS